MTAFLGGQDSVARAAAPPAGRPTPTAVPTPSPPLSTQPTLVVNACRDLATPNRTYKLRGAGAEIFSTGPIGGPGCTGFVADLELDAASAPGAGDSFLPEIELQGRDAVREDFFNQSSGYGPNTYYAKISKAECTTFKHSFVIYKKLAGETSFSSFAGGALVPTWNEKGVGFGPICILAPGPNFKPVPKVTPPKQGTDVYRAVVTVANAPGQLTYWAQHVRK